MAQIAIIGCGVVGSGTAELLLNKKDLLQTRAGEEIALKYILDRKPLDNELLRPLQVETFEEIERDSAVDIVVEAIGGTVPAYDYVKRALLAGKSVVTSNKELIATHGGELLEIAAARNCALLFEGSVGGGTPILYPLVHSLWANRIERVAGIVNGTSNFILTKMFEEDMSFAAALALASELGYAESDPSADVDGLDACRKLAILASLAFGRGVNVGGIPTTGIRGITSADVAAAKALGYAIKLIAHAQNGGNKPELCVRPMLVPERCPLSNVSDVLNAVLFDGDSVGSVMFYGRGAGKEATASAVVSDILLAATQKRFIPGYSFPRCTDGDETYSGGKFARYLRTSGNCPTAIQLGEEYAHLTPLLTDEQFAGYKAELVKSGNRITAELHVLADF